jgi:hypothetical protein
MAKRADINDKLDRIDEGFGPDISFMDVWPMKDGASVPISDWSGEERHCFDAESKCCWKLPQYKHLKTIGLHQKIPGNMGRRP